MTASVRLTIAFDDFHLDSFTITPTYTYSTNSTQNSIRNINNTSHYKIVTDLRQHINSIPGIKKKSHSLNAHEKNDVIASEINDENETYSMLKLKILSAIEFIRSKRRRADIESIYDQLTKTNSFNLEISSIDEALSKLIDHNLVSKKKTSAGLDSFRVLT